MPYDVAAADRAVEFFKRGLRHTKGEWRGKPFILKPWQEHEIIRPLFGTLRDDGLRQYRMAYISLPRKNGKSELVAGIGLYLLYADHEPGAEIYVAAATRGEASRIFDVAGDMVLMSPALRHWGLVKKSSKVIHLPRSGSIFKALAGEVPGNWGFNSHGVLFDELHDQKNRLLWDALTTSSGSRRQPLTVAITTAGNDKESLCYEIYTYAKRVASGEVDDPSFFAYIREAPEDADWTDPGVQKAANPALGDFRYGDELERDFKQAMEMPSREAAFRQLYLNQWTETSVVWLPARVWDEMRQPISEKRLRGRACFGGLDLASTTDLAAFVLVFPPEKRGEKFVIKPYFWLPRASIPMKERVERKPYGRWVKEEHIIATEGDEIDYKSIRQVIEKAGAAYDIQEIAYDRWGAVQLARELTDDGATLLPMGQGMASMSGPSKDFETLYMGRQFAHAGNPAMDWMMRNVYVERDGYGNIKPSKKHSTAKIDGPVALIMGLSRAVLYEPSVYSQKGGMLVL